MKYFLHLITILALMACHESEKQYQSPVYDKKAIAHFSWLTGLWKKTDKGTEVFEEWKKDNDSCMSARKFYIKGGDSVITENLSLYQKQDKLELKINSEENGEKRLFFSDYNYGQFIFENNENLFPKQISYKGPQPDFLCTRLEGIKNGNHLIEDKCYVKVK